MHFVRDQENLQILQMWEAREGVISYCRKRIRIQEPVERKKMNKVDSVILVGCVVCCRKYYYNSD